MGRKGAHRPTPSDPIPSHSTPHQERLIAAGSSHGLRIVQVFPMAVRPDLNVDCCQMIGNSVLPAARETPTLSDQGGFELQQQMMASGKGSRRERHK